MMNRLVDSVRNVAVRAQALVSQAETVCELDPEMCEAAAMVYVGDVYALREVDAALEDDGWGSRCYTCDIGQDPL